MLCQIVLGPQLSTHVPDRHLLVYPYTSYLCLDALLYPYTSAVQYSTVGIHAHIYFYNSVSPLPCAHGSRNPTVTAIKSRYSLHGPQDLNIHRYCRGYIVPSVPVATPCSPRDLYCTCIVYTV